MKRIAIFQSDMRVGGIQRSLANLLKCMADSQDCKIDVFIFDADNVFYKPCESNNIRVFYLNKLPYFNRLLPFSLVKLLWSASIKKQIMDATGEADSKYDVAIDFNSYWNECALGAILTEADRRVCWVHNDVQIKMKEEFKYRILHLFFKNKYKFFDKMAMVSQGIVEPFYKMNNNAPKVHVVINNVIDTKEIKRLLNSEDVEETAVTAIEDIKKHPNRVEFVSVGRLCHQKGYDLLIEQVKKLSLKKSNQEVHFTIIGDGPLGDELVRSIDEKGLKAYFNFTGNLKNPFPLMAVCDGFFMCSRYEGQPLAFWEAKALKLPVIIPEHLEKYTGGISGSKDIVKVLEETKKRTKTLDVDELMEYNRRILDAFGEL